VHLAVPRQLFLLLLLLLLHLRITQLVVLMLCLLLCLCIITRLMMLAVQGVVFMARTLGQIPGLLQLLLFLQ
jgi:hypothetical protein